MACTVPTLIEELTVADLESNRWCVYHNDEKGYDGFEFAIPETHPDFSGNVVEIELAHFVFSGGEIFKGLFDGSESFSVFHNGNWYSLWYGVSKPSDDTVNEFKEFLAINHLALPVSATAVWSCTSRTYNGLQYVDYAGAIRELVI